jgi:hypothetical protein
MLCWRSTPLLRLLGKKLRTYWVCIFSPVFSKSLNLILQHFHHHFPDTYGCAWFKPDSWSFLFKSLLEMNPIYEDVASGGSSQSPTDFWQLLRTFQNSSIFLYINTFEIPQSLSDIKPEPDLSLEALVLVSPTAQIHPTIWLFETHKVLAHWSSLPKSLSFQRLSLPGCFKSCGSKRKHWLHSSFSSLHTFLAATQKDWP